MCLQEQLDNFIDTLKTGDIVVFKTKIGIPCIGKFEKITEKAEFRHVIHLGWNGGGIPIPVKMIDASSMRRAMTTEIMLWKLQDEVKSVGSHNYNNVIGGEPDGKDRKRKDREGSDIY